MCASCRQQLHACWRDIRIEGINIHYLYTYEGYFKSMLLQYKEGGDEALAPVFLGAYAPYLAWRYRHYSLVCLPSTQKKLQERGFEHVALMCQKLGLKRKKIALKKELCQAGKNRNQRLAMRHNFCLADEYQKTEKILLVDDVLTSGSSLLGARELLSPWVKKVEMFVFGIAILKK